VVGKSNASGELKQQDSRLNGLSPNFEIISDPINQPFEVYRSRFACDPIADLVVGGVTLLVGFVLYMGRNLLAFVLSIVVVIVFAVDIFLIIQLRGKIEPEVRSSAEILEALQRTIYCAFASMVLYIPYKVYGIIVSPPENIPHELIPAAIFILIRVTQFFVRRGFKQWVNKWHTDFGGPGFKTAGDPREQSLQTA